VPTRELRSLTAIIGHPASEHARFRLAAYNGPEGFRAIRAATEATETGIVLTSEQLAALGVQAGMPVDTVPLPERDSRPLTQPSPVPAFK
jgi:hypothetical protein